MSNPSSQPTLEPDKRSGQPCIRGLRNTVYDVQSYLVAGMTEAEILDDFPELEPEDIRACLVWLEQTRLALRLEQPRLV